jgi:hypothetical protein
MSTHLGYILQASELGRFSNHLGTIQLILDRAYRAYLARHTLMNTAFKNSLTLLAAALALLGAPALRAQVLTFNVDINTATLAAQDGANAPFYLDFSMVYGGDVSLASNTATLSNFALTGGTALGSAVTSGTASGNITSTAALTASSTHPSSVLYQEFSSGVTNISFTASVTETGPDVGTPTVFSTAILDNSLGSPPQQLYTTAPDTESLVLLNLNSANTLSNVGTYTSISSADGNTPVTGVTASVTAIPEPSTTAAIVGAAAVLFALCARRFNRLGAV